MKPVYVAALNDAMLADIKDTFRAIDPNQDKYRIIVNQFERKNIQTATLNDILSLTNSGSLDLMVLPLHLSEESRMAAKAIYENHAMDFDGVKLGLRYAEEGYCDPILLVTDEYYSATQAMSVENAGGLIPRANGFGTYFLHLYSTELPNESKIETLLHLLEDHPLYNFFVLDMGSRKKGKISFSPPSPLITYPLRLKE